MRSARFNHRTFYFHLLFWMLYLLSNAYLWYTFDKTYNETTYYGLTRLPIKLIAVYVNLFLLTRFFFQKQYVAFTCFFLLNLILAGLTQTYISVPGAFNYQRVTQYTLPICSLTLLSSAVLLVQLFFIKMNESKQLEIEKVKSELNFLKTQFQPHFLFNTLNNIYSLTFNNIELAGKSILQLSSLLRYVLYESEAEKVDLQKEISHLRDYIDLEKIRFTETMEISFNISGNISDKKIAPILLVPFLENAFKHASGKMNEPVWVTVDLIVKENDLCFTVENSVFQNGKVQLQHAYPGIGLKNVTKRLSLLYKNYTLNHELKDNYYHVFLKVPLN